MRTVLIFAMLTMLAGCAGKKPLVTNPHAPADDSSQQRLWQNHRKECKTLYQTNADVWQCLRNKGWPV